MIDKPRGSALLKELAKRVIATHLENEGHRDIAVRPAAYTGDVDIAFERLGNTVGVKVHADPYYGVDGAKCTDMSLPFYRQDSGEAALQSIAHHVTREPGWAIRCDADLLFDYALAVDQTEDEIIDLMDEPDEVFLPQIRITRDSLRIIPFDELCSWFEANQEDYPSRPIDSGGHSAWYRIVPRADLERAIPGLKRVGSIYRSR